MDPFRRCHCQKFWKISGKIFWIKRARPGRWHFQGCCGPSSKRLHSAFRPALLPDLRYQRRLTHARRLRFCPHLPRQLAGKTPAAIPKDYSRMPSTRCRSKVCR